MTQGPSEPIAHRDRLRDCILALQARAHEFPWILIEEQYLLACAVRELARAKKGRAVRLSQEVTML